MSVRKRPTGCLGSSACRSPAIGAIREKQRFGSSLRNRSSGRAARLSDKCVIESAVSFGCATQWIAYPFLGAAEVAGPNIHLTARPLGVREGGVVSSATRWRHSYLTGMFGVCLSHCHVGRGASWLWSKTVLTLGFGGA